MQMRRGLPPNVSPMLPEGYQGYEGYGAQPPRPVQSVQEILTQPLGEPTPNLSGVSGSASRQREIADLLMQGVQNQDNTSIAGGLSQLGQAFLARGARKKADAAEAKRDEVASLLMQQALGGDRNAMAQIMPVADILARDDRKERYGVEDEFTRTQIAQGQQGLDLQGRGVNLQERGLDHTITQDQFSNDLRGREFDLNAEIGRAGLGVDRGRLDLQREEMEQRERMAELAAQAEQAQVNRPIAPSAERGVQTFWNPETNSYEQSIVPGGPVEREAREADEAAAEVRSRSFKTVEALLDHGQFKQAYGFEARLPKLPGSGREEVEALRDQVGGQAFLQAFESLKGGGTITEIEGQRATDAITRINNPNLSPAAALRAGEELLEIIDPVAFRQRQARKAMEGGNLNLDQSMDFSGASDDDLFNIMMGGR